MEEKFLNEKMSSVAHADARGSQEEVGKMHHQQQQWHEESSGATAMGRTGEGVSVDTIDTATQKRVVRKLDWNIIPLVTALCKGYFNWHQEATDKILT